MTQNKQILEALKKGDKLTPLEMLYRFGTLRASARIFDLKAQGHDIQSKIVNKDGKQVSEYSLKRPERLRTFQLEDGALGAEGEGKGEKGDHQTSLPIREDRDSRRAARRKKRNISKNNKRPL